MTRPEEAGTNSVGFWDGMKSMGIGALIGLAIIGLLMMTGCDDSTRQARIEAAWKVRRQEAERVSTEALARNLEWCKGLGGTAVVSSYFDGFYLQHCIVGEHPVTIELEKR